MPLTDLTEEEKAVVFECLRCVAAGKVIPHDWEFPTIFGIEASDFVAIVEAWPNIDDSNETVFLAINNSMNNLLGYPHDHYTTWDPAISVSKEQLAKVFQKWRGENISGYFNGLR